MVYIGLPASLIRTLKGQSEVSVLERCPYHRDFRIREVSVWRGSIVGYTKQANRDTLQRTPIAVQVDTLRFSILTESLLAIIKYKMFLDRLDCYFISRWAYWVG